MNNVHEGQVQAGWRQCLCHVTFQMNSGSPGSDLVVDTLIVIRGHAEWLNQCINCLSDVHPEHVPDSTKLI